MAFKFKAQKAQREKIAVKVALMGPSGSGKALTLDSDIYTPDGIKKMGDIKLGEMVYSDDGIAYPVSGVFPQGKKKCYRITFSDGSFVDCSEDHLWAVRKSGENYKIKSTKEILDGGLKLPCNKWKYFIPVCKPIEMPENEHFIDPYILGVLLGDGGLTGGNALLTSSEKDIIDRIEEKLPDGMKIKTICPENKAPYHLIQEKERGIGNGVTSELRRLGLMGEKSVDKFIPNEYLYDSIENRIELLRGLMDTDGSVEGINNSNKNGLSFSSASEKIIDNFRTLIFMLGGTATKAERETYYYKNGEKVGPFKSYRSFFKLPKVIIPFSSKKHFSVGYAPQLNSYRGIRDIEYIGEKECQCITVDSPSHLFLTNSCIVTHNTFSSLALAKGMTSRMKEIGALDGTNGRILVANTEGSRGRYYASEFEYDIVDLEPPYNPELFVDLINYAVDEKYSVLVIDSSSEEWTGKGGCLELQQQAGGTYQAWSKVTPRHNKFIEAITTSPIHIIATMRGKDQYEVEKDDRGRVNVKKLGVGSQQRDGMEYYFTCTFGIDQVNHMARCEKDNTHIFEGEGAVLLDERYGERLIDWANSGEAENSDIKKFKENKEAQKATGVPELEDTINSIGSLAKALADAGVAKKTIADTISSVFVVNGKPSANYNAIKDVVVAREVLESLEKLK